MRLEQLEYLLSLQETGSISRTAERYIISHQAVSKAIQALEKEFSVVILERSSKGVRLTPAGLRFCQFAEIVLAEKERLGQELASYKTQSYPTITGDLVIYAVPRYITPPFLNFIEKMRIAFPKLNLVLNNATADSIIEKVSFTENTIALFTSGYNEIEHAGKLSAVLKSFTTKHHLQYQILDDQLLYACVHQKSPLCQIESFSCVNTQQYPFVSFTYPFDTSYAAQFVIDSFEQQKNLIKRGNCFGRYTKQEFDTFFSKNYRLIPLQDHSHLTFIAMYQKDHTNKNISFFLERLHKEMKF